MKVNEEYRVIMRQYVGLSETILEGWLYVIDNTENPNEKLVNQIFNDSLVAVSQLSNTTEVLCYEFQENTSIVDGFGGINNIIKILTEHEDCLSKKEERNVLLVDKLIPMLDEWNKKIETIVSGYVYH